MSTVLVATTLGAVIGPNLVEPMGSLAGALGIRELAGSFMLAAVAYGLAAIAVHLLLRPDPLLTARASGIVVASASYAALSLDGGALALVLIPALIVERRQATPALVDAAS